MGGGTGLGQAGPPIEVDRGQPPTATPSRRRGFGSAGGRRPRNSSTYCNDRCSCVRFSPAEKRAHSKRSSTSHTTSDHVGALPYRSIQDPAKLRRILEATFLLEADLDLDVLLRHIVSEARSITHAQYGALGVLNEDRSALVELRDQWLDAAEEQAIGDRPKGRGVLGLLIGDPEPVRVAHIQSHPESYGFPANHPPMDSFLGVPIRVRGRRVRQSVSDQQTRLVRVHQR